MIFEKFLSPEIFLNSATVLGGYTFGTGVTVSIFQISANSPFLTEQFMTSASGVDSSTANSLIILDGMSSFTVHAFVLILFKYSYTWCGSRTGAGLLFLQSSRLNDDQIKKKERAKAKLHAKFRKEMGIQDGGETGSAVASRVSQLALDTEIS